MANPIYEATNEQHKNNANSKDIIRQFGSFKQDPFGFMMKRKGINIPIEYRNNPQEAVQYLINSGQMSPEQLEYIKSVAQRMGISF